ncbi:toxin-antitoxin system HicB family antitoxin [Clostridium sp. VAP23]|uniref:toxin-antitoxin system HicB family antitoxin n=1 Tax=Clostridium sp. VAP23 TaxID=2949981 RepID=UPI002079A4C6|nr:toxin-antitoxin system HicB family antitoxin [Clostridium sp. VAP23]
MKNTIIYGDAATGKTTEYFEPEIQKWEGKTIAISFKEGKQFKGFKNFYLDNNNISFEEILSYEKVFLSVSSQGGYWYNEGLKNFKNLVIYIIKNINNFEKQTLIAIDEFTQFDLSEKINDKESLILQLLNLVNTYLVVQDLKQIKKIYKSDYPKIISLSNVICTKKLEEYSGELRVRFPKSLHKYLAEESKKEDISINQYIVFELAKVMGKNN